MSKRIDYIVDDIREATENEVFDSQTGLTEEEIIRYVNDAQYRLHSKIVSVHPEVFSVVEEQDIVSDQESYNLNYNAYLNNKVLSVEYRTSSNPDDYYMLRKVTPKLRDTGAEGSPCNYFMQGGKIFLVGTPSRGSLRITYIRKVRALDKRRYKLTSGPTLIADEVLTTSTINGNVDVSVMRQYNSITMVDARGNVEAENVLISNVTGSTLTIDSSYVKQTGETTASGSYIIPGEYSSSHLDEIWGPDVERYIRAYVEWKVLKRDSSVDSAEAIRELVELESEIIAAYANIEDDLMEIPEINNEDWWEI